MCLCFSSLCVIKLKRRTVRHVDLIEMNPSCARPSYYATAWNGIDFGIVFWLPSDVNLRGHFAAFSISILTRSTRSADSTLTEGIALAADVRTYELVRQHLVLTATLVAAFSTPTTLHCLS